MTQNCPEISWLDLAAAETRNEKQKSWNATHCPWQCTSCWREWWRRRVTSLQRTFNGNGICTFVFVYFHVRHPGTSFLRFSYNNLLKNIAYVMVYTLYKVVLPFAKGLFVPHGTIRFFSRIASTMAALCASADMNLTWPHLHGHPQSIMISFGNFLANDSCGSVTQM